MHRCDKEQEQVRKYCMIIFWKLKSFIHVHNLILDFIRQVTIMDTNVKPYKTTSIQNKNKYVFIYATVRKINENFDRSDA